MSKSCRHHLAVLAGSAAVLGGAALWPSMTPPPAVHLVSTESSLEAPADEVWWWLNGVAPQGRSTSQRAGENTAAAVRTSFCGLICNGVDGSAENPNGQHGGLLFGNGGNGYFGGSGGNGGWISGNGGNAGEGLPGQAARDGGRAGLFGNGGNGGHAIYGGAGGKGRRRRPAAGQRGTGRQRRTRGRRKSGREPRPDRTCGSRTGRDQRRQRRSR
ncbi:hypothetical protein H7I76_30305 [Mycolicibacterium vaccae]|nr:hypothetical protein [Mycolicibacterium vaccae]